VRCAENREHQREGHEDDECDGNFPQDLDLSLNLSRREIVLYVDAVIQKNGLFGGRHELAEDKSN